MGKKIKWIATLTIAGITAFVLIIGFVSCIFITSASSAKNVFNINENKKISNNPKEGDKMKKVDNKSCNILVMGDSLAKGTGDEKGKGFAGNFTDLWKTKETKPINLIDIAVNGDTSSGLVNVVSNQQTLKYIEGSKIIFISIGGNEIKNFRNYNVDSASLGNNEMKSAQDKYLKNLKTVFNTIRSKNSNCMVVFIGLYNPFGKNITLDKIKLLEDWNYETSKFVCQDSNAVFIPTYDLFKCNIDSYLAPDNFHPNGAGYDAISNRIFEALKNYKDNK